MRKSDQAKIVGDVWAAIGSVSLLAGVGVFGYQLIMWHEYDDWMPMTFGNLYQQLFGPLPHIEWSGLLNIVNWTFDCPSSLVGLTLAFLAMMLSVQYKRKSYRLLVGEEKNRGWEGAY
jgi:hypothetical protein